MRDLQDFLSAALGLTCDPSSTSPLRVRPNHFHFHRPFATGSCFAMRRWFLEFARAVRWSKSRTTFRHLFTRTYLHTYRYRALPPAGRTLGASCRRRRSYRQSPSHVYFYLENRKSLLVVGVQQASSSGMHFAGTGRNFELHLGRFGKTANELQRQAANPFVGRADDQISYSGGRLRRRPEPIPQSAHSCRPWSAAARAPVSLMPALTILSADSDSPMLLRPLHPPEDWVNPHRQHRSSRGRSRKPAAPMLRVDELVGRIPIRSWLAADRCCHCSVLLLVALMRARLQNLMEQGAYAVKFFRDR